MKSLIVLVSYHHNNTQKIAEVLAKVLNAQAKTPEQIKPDELQQYDLIGFGSGIYASRHHKTLRRFVDELPTVSNKKAFIFSTCSNTKNAPKYHSVLREKLQSKGYTIVGEFNCAGFITWGPYKLVGGLKKGRPNAEDLKLAEEFAKNLKLNSKRCEPTCH
jgi:flavodoxin